MPFLRFHSADQRNALCDNVMPVSLSKSAVKSDYFHASALSLVMCLDSLSLQTSGNQLLVSSAHSKILHKTNMLKPNMQLKRRKLNQ